MLINVWGTTNQKWKTHFRQGNYLSELSFIFCVLLSIKDEKIPKVKQTFLLHYLTHYLSFVIIILFSCLATH